MEDAFLLVILVCHSENNGNTLFWKDCSSCPAVRRLDSRQEGTGEAGPRLRSEQPEAGDTLVKGARGYSVR